MQDSLPPRHINLTEVTSIIRTSKIAAVNLQATMYFKAACYFFKYHQRAAKDLGITVFTIA